MFYFVLEGNNDAYLYINKILNLYVSNSAIVNIKNSDKYNFNSYKYIYPNDEKSHSFINEIDVKKQSLLFNQAGNLINKSGAILDGLEYFLIPWGAYGVCELYLFATNNKMLADRIMYDCKYIISNYESDKLQNINWHRFILDSHLPIKFLHMSCKLKADKWLFVFRKVNFESLNAIYCELKETEEFENNGLNIEFKEVKNEITSLNQKKCFFIKPTNIFTLYCLLELSSYIDGSVISIYDYRTTLVLNYKDIMNSFQEKTQLKKLIKLTNISNINVINDIFYYDEPQTLVTIKNNELSRKFYNICMKNKSELLGVF